MSNPAARSTEQLLRDSRWIGRLALSLAGDAETAQDLVQETWLVALRAEAKGKGGSRAWLAGVLHNLARRRGRGERRRVRREQERENQTQEVPSTEDLVLRAEAQQRVARAVLQLEEPLRTTLLLRFFEDRSTADIAAQLRLAPDSVRARIRRGIRQLRSDLEGSQPGDRASWLALLLPVRRPIPVLPAAGKVGRRVWQGAAWPLAAQLALPAGLLMTAALWLLALNWQATKEPSIRWQPATQEPAAVAGSSSESTKLVGRVPDRSRRALDPNQPLQTIGGSVTFVLPDGTRIQDSSGELQLLIGADGTSLRVPIPLADGRWKLPSSLENPAQVRVAGLWMEHEGQRRRALKLPEWSAGELSTRHQHWTVPVEALACVHLIDSETEAELVGVQVLADSPEFTGSPLVDNAHRRDQVLCAGPSPLWIPLGDANGAPYSVWAGGDGLQWQRLDLATDQDSEHWVRPARGGELLIEFQGGRALPGCELELEALGRTLVLEEGGWYTPLEAVDQVHLTGLPAGRYWAALSFQPTFAEFPHAVPLGRCQAQVYPGEQTAVVLERAELAEAPTLELRARLRIPPAWKLENFHLRVHPIRAGTAFQEHAWTEATLPLDEDGRARVSIHDLQAGIYLLDFFSVGVVHHRMVVDLQAPLAKVRLELPPPVELRVLVVDSEGSPQTVRTMYRTTEPDEGVAGRATAFDCDGVLPGGWIPIRVPAGPCKLSLTTDDGRRVTQEVDAQGGSMDVVLTVD